jgi:hypothetical protein
MMHTQEAWHEFIRFHRCRRCYGCPPRYVPSSSPSPSASSQCSVVTPQPVYYTQDHHPPRPPSAPRSPSSSRSTSSTQYTPSSSHAPQTSSRPSASHSTLRNPRYTLRCCNSISHLTIDDNPLQLQRTAVRRRLRSRPPWKSSWRGWRRRIRARYLSGAFQCFSSSILVVVVVVVVVID